MQALKDALFDEFIFDEDRTDNALSNEILGQIYRAKILGMERIDRAFKKIARYKSRPEAAPKINGAR